jgi:hypothetical protein
LCAARGVRVAGGAAGSLPIFSSLAYELAACKTLGIPIIEL